eukprot:jgi/Mesvir1/4527/Mv25706-RA.1
MRVDAPLLWSLNRPAAQAHVSCFPPPCPCLRLTNYRATATRACTLVAARPSLVPSATTVTIAPAPIWCAIQGMACQEVS